MLKLPDKNDNISKEEEIKLFDEFKAGNIESRNKLINSVARYIYHLSNGDDDEFQRMYLKILKEIDRFDPKLGRLTTWVHHVIGLGRHRERRRAQFKYIQLQIWHGFKKSQKLAESKYPTVDLNKLNEREQFIIRAALKGYNLGEIGACFGLCRERIRQIIKFIKRKLTQ